MTNSHVYDFISRTEPIARQVENVYGIPFEVTIAMAALETGWGKHVKGNNYFGIKGEGQSFETSEYIDGNKVSLIDSFRAYSSLEESFLDFGHFLNVNRRYQIALTHTSNPERFVKEVHAAGYATDPEYANKIISIMRRWNFGKTTFLDVPTSHWAHESIKEMHELGILLGYPDGDFKPNEEVTRAEFSVTLKRLIDFLTRKED